MAKKKAPRLTFNVIKSFADPNTSDEKIKEILFGDADEDGFSYNACALFRPFLGIGRNVYASNPKKFIEAVEIYAQAVERALAVCGDDLLYCFRMFGNDNAGSVNLLLFDRDYTDPFTFNAVGSGMSIQNDIVCQYVLVNQDKYPHFAAELSKYNNDVFNAMKSNWTRPYNQTKEYVDGDIVVAPLSSPVSQSQLFNYLDDGSPLHFQVRTTKNETDYIGIGVYVSQTALHYLCGFNPRYYSNIGSDSELSSPAIVLDVVGCSEEQSKDFPEFATKAIATILNMIKENVIVINDPGYRYYGIDDINHYKWNNDDSHYIDAGLGGQRVVEILMSEEIASEDYKFFDKVFTDNGFKDCGVTPYVGHDEEGEETIYNMHHYYQVVDIKSLFPDEEAE